MVWNLDLSTPFFSCFLFGRVLLSFLPIYFSCFLFGPVLLSCPYFSCFIFGRVLLSCPYFSCFIFGRVLLSWPYFSSSSLQGLSWASHRSGVSKLLKTGRPEEEKQRFKRWDVTVRTSIQPTYTLLIMWRVPLLPDRSCFSCTSIFIIDTQIWLYRIMSLLNAWKPPYLYVEIMPRWNGEDILASESLETKDQENHEKVKFLLVLMEFLKS